MNLLTFSTLYPNSAQPAHGVFVEQRLRQLLKGSGVSSKVVAPVPWFPIKTDRFGKYGKFAAAPDSEVRHGISIQHPRYPVVPKVGMSVAPGLLALSARTAVRNILRNGYDFDIIDAHYFYPDGVAAVALGKWVGKPVVITARGTDLSLIPEYLLPRKMIQWAAKNAAGIVTVCEALKGPLLELGVYDRDITVLRNGVDLGFFKPGDRLELRSKLGFEQPTLVSVGHLIERKAHDLAIRALSELDGVRLVIIGTGVEENALRSLTASLRLEERVTFAGGMTQETLRDYYCAADALVLASSREGWANVLLESMACGTPVIASNVWGTPEVVAAPEAGVLMQERTPAGLTHAYRKLIDNYPDHAQTRRYAEGFSWEATSDGQMNLFNGILQSSEKGRA